MIEKKGKYPCNARIDIDYVSGKPKIKIGYPSNNPKKDAINQATHPILIIVIALFLIVPFYILLAQQPFPPPISCGNFSVNNSDGAKSFNLTCDNEIKVFTFDENTNKFFIKGLSTREIQRVVKYLWIYFLGFSAFFISKQITRILIKKKWYQEWIPKSQANGILFKTKIKKCRRFNSKDLLENIVVIPRFSNVELDYKAKGEFSKYLEKIKIREYKERKINIKTNKKIKKKIKKKSKEKADKFKWYAVFYFKKKPKTGYLEVIYQ